MTRMRTISLCTLSGLLAVGLAISGCSSSDDSEDAVADDSTSDSDSTMSSTSGGSTTDGGSTSDGGSTTGGAMLGIWTDMQPCGNTIAGDEIKKGTACTDEDVDVCWRSCGPESIGRKTETCTGGAYAEGDCMFNPDVDHGCFSVPDTIDASCPADPPQATQPCTVNTCTPCNAGGEYLDSGGSVKQGYCVCQEPNDEGESTWTCASTTAWPCPAANGC